MTNRLEDVNMVVLEDIQRHNQWFIRRAIEEWDTQGVSDVPFHLWIQRWTAWAWWDMVRRN